jgi:hypothetical protein
MDDYPVPGVTNALKDAGIVDTTWFTEWARDRGSKVHRITQYYDEDDLDESTVDPRLMGYLDAWKRFRREYELEIQAVELEVYHPTAMYGGTLDRLAFTTLKGQRHLTILDIKTGKVERATGLQLTGYADAYTAMTGEFIGRIIGVQLMQDGRYKMTPFPLDFMTWRAVLTIANWQKEA